jgi:hypothetical protein
MTARVERGCEYRRIESRITRVEHHIGPFAPGEFGDRGGIRRVERMSYESRIVTSVNRRGRPQKIQIGDDHVLENFGFRSRSCDRGSDSTGSDYENAHAFTLRATVQARVICR